MTVEGMKEMHFAHFQFPNFIKTVMQYNIN